MLLNLFDRVGIDDGGAGAGRRAACASPARELAKRRRQALGSAITALTYSEPLHVQRGEGPWLFDADGRRLLDAYNNVPVVGHCHPRVTEAVVRQTRTLNTHARYLYEPLIELAERLIAAMPDGSGLDTVVVVNSGSEANDLAWRIARACTGGSGALVTRLRLPRRDHGDRRALARGVARRLPAARRRDGRRRRHDPAGRRDGCRRRPPARSRRRARRGVPRRRVHQRRHAHARSRRRRRHGRRLARGGRPVRGRRGAGRPRPHGRRTVVVPGASASRPTSSRWASRWATATRSPR